MKRVTLQDIADELGISRNTVSKAINNSDGIAAATRDKILQKAVEMGYKQFSYVNSILASDEITSFPVTRQYQGEICLYYVGQIPARDLPGGLHNEFPPRHKGESEYHDTPIHLPQGYGEGRSLH